MYEKENRQPCVSDKMVNSSRVKRDVSTVATRRGRTAGGNVHPTCPLILQSPEVPLGYAQKVFHCKAKKN